MSRFFAIKEFKKSAKQAKEGQILTLATLSRRENAH